MIKTVIFDFDGTIANTLPKVFELYNRYSDEFSLPKINKKEAEELRSKSAFEIIKSFGISVIKIPGMANKVRKELNNSITEVKMFKGVAEVLQRIKSKGLQLGLLTSNSQENVEKYLGFYNVDKLFDFIHSEKSLFGKSATLGKLITRYKLDKNATVYVGDEVRDIDASRDNGIRIISVTWGFNTKKSLQENTPDYLVSKPAEILDIVAKN